MSKNTALGAEKSKERRITFKNKEHEKFYQKYLSKCRYCQRSAKRRYVVRGN